MNNFEYIERLFRRVDELLDDSIVLYMAGGAALLAHGIVGRETQDVDVIDPIDLPADLLCAVDTVAQEFHEIYSWLNAQAASKEHPLTPGWKKRARPAFQGKKLSVFTVGRADLLGMKLAAVLSRLGDDRADVLAMKPTKEEWEFARRWARQYERTPGWAKDIDRLVAALSEKTGG